MAVDYEYLVRVLGALLTPLIAIVAAYIAWQQWRIKRTELHLALYDRRLAVYKAVDSFYGEVAVASGSFLSLPSRDRRGIWTSSIRQDSAS